MPNLGAASGYAKKAQEKGDGLSLGERNLVEKARRAEIARIMRGSLLLDHDTFEDTKLGRLMTLIDPIVIALIILNAIMMGIGTFDFVDDNPKLRGIFDYIDNIFLIIFTVEIVLSSTHYLRLDSITYSEGSLGFLPMHAQEAAQRKANLPWIIFDALVVILSWSFRKLSVIRAFRILRALRLIARVESMKRVVKGLLSVGPKMSMVAFLLSILLLLFGIMFTQLFKTLYDDGYTSEDYFGTFFLTLLTLFQIMTFDSWHGIARSAMNAKPYAWVVFVLWVLISGFVVMNLIIAIICESLVTMTVENKKLDKREKEGLDDSIAGSIQTVMDFKIFQIQEVADEILLDQGELLEIAQDLKLTVLGILMDVRTGRRNVSKADQAELMKVLHTLG
jgi:hypothetical protein